MANPIYGFRCTVYMALLCLLLSCGQRRTAGNGYLSREDSIAAIDLPQLTSNKKLTIITLYSSVSYFIYRGEPMGYDYDLCKDFAASLGLKLDVVVAKNETQLVDMLNNGDGDMIACNIPVTNQLKQEIIYCGKESVSNQVLIQRKYSTEPVLSDVTQLIGKEIYVQMETKYEQRLLHLNEELGGGIIIHDIDKDSITTEDMIEMVSIGKIPFTIADADIAALNRTYYNNIDVNLAISFPQRSSWAVRKTSPKLATALNDWVAENKTTTRYQAILKRYFEISKNSKNSPLLSIQNGRISAYDHLFKVYSLQIGLDWRLMASIAYQESGFNNTAVSWAGAQGLMQIMPSTFVGLGGDLDDITDPETSVRLAAKYIRNMDNSFKNIDDPNERIKFMLAAYNSGLGHVYDAQALAKKYGKNPNIWDANVDEYILLKSNPEYYTDSVCKFGYFRGKETHAYVQQVLARYEYYKSRIGY